MAVNILLKRSSTASKRPTAASMQYGELNLNYDAATGGIYYKDSAGGVVKVGPCQVSATAPNSTPAGSAGNSAGEFWYDTSTSTLKIYNAASSTWVSAGTAGAVTGITGTLPIHVDNTDPTQPVIGVYAATTVGNEGVVQLSNDINANDTNGWAATPFAVKLVNDNANTKLSMADGGTMFGSIVMDAGTSIYWTGNSSQQTGITSSTSTTSATLAASATAVKAAYDLGSGALPKSGGTMTGGINLAMAGVTFADTSNLTAISDSTSTTSSSTAASSTAVKNAYNLAAAALPASGGTLTGTLTFAAGQTFPVSGIQIATTGQLGVVQVGTNISVDGSGVISVASASTSAAGIVQLYNNTDSTSTSLALTAAQGKNLQDQIDALAVTSNLTLAGTFDASTGLVDSVTVAGTAAGFAVGSALPAAASGNADYFVIVDVQGSTGPSGTPPYHIGDWFLSDGTSWQFLNVGYQAPYATTSEAGIVELATDAEVQAGSDTTRAVVPSALQSKMSDSTSTASSTTIASSTAVKSAYDLADAALPKAGGTMTGTIVFDAGQTFPAAGIQDATTSQKGVVQVGTNIDVAAGVISVASASTSAAGVVQLTDSTSSTSTTTAATPNAVKSAYDLAAAAVPESVATAKGDILVGTGSGVVGVRAAGTDGQFLVADSADASGLSYTSTVDGGTY